MGLIAITDVYEAEAARDLSEVQRIVEENNVAVAKERLSILTGQSHGDLYRLSEDFDAQPPTPTDRAAWVKFALDGNYDLAAARYAEESARQSAKASAMEHAPTVTASYQYSDTELDGTQSSEPRQLFQIQPDSQTPKKSGKFVSTCPSTRADDYMPSDDRPHSSTSPPWKAASTWSARPLPTRAPCT